jgi:multicomponent K+:H+ antiporter subunit G
MIADILIAALLVVAGFFGLVGSVGLMKLPDPMTRLHAPTKATTLGVGGALIASMAYFWVYEGRLSWHELMITLFLFLTAPITAHFIAKVQLHLTIRRRDLPPTGTGHDWAGRPDRAPDRAQPRDSAG